MKKRWLWGGVLAVVAVGLTYGIEQYRNFTAVQAQASTFSDKMKLNNLDGSVAPNFTLSDESGKTVSLSDFKGKVVVVQFMDPECTDICPVVSSEIVGADKILAGKQSDVVFLTVNVNQYHESKVDLMNFSKQHGLASLPNWYFLTGSTDELKAVWKKYGITVVPNPTGDVEHSSFMYFLDKSEHEQYIANPDNSKASISEWSQGIAFYANRLI